MTKSVLIIGEDPAEIDFDAPDAPPDMSEQKVMDGLNGSADRLRAKGYAASLLLTKDESTVEIQTRDAVANDPPDVIVIGAGLRTLPKMAAQFELLINVLREVAPDAKLGFNSEPNDSDVAALRWL